MRIVNATQRPFYWIMSDYFKGSSLLVVRTTYYGQSRKLWTCC